MPTIKFKTPEYHRNGVFKEVRYEFRGDESGGWDILREGRLHVHLGPGYTPVQSLYCGVCATDLARQHLPFPLPQVIGHEIAGWKSGNLVVVEINASHLARRDRPESCPYCLLGLGSHCPGRMTLGIDRLPGGLSPYFLAPVDAIHEVPEEISPLSAVFTEPFAAALKGVEVSPPRDGDRVAVLGPRRLGMLVIAALADYRKRTRLNFEITGIVRHDRLEGPCLLLGADQVINIKKTPVRSLRHQFDIVFDTTGKQEGLECALELTRRILHLKSTHGRPVLGLNRITDVVVDEIALLPYCDKNLRYRWPADCKPRANANIYVSPSIPDRLLQEARRAHPEGRFDRMGIREALAYIKKALALSGDSPLPRFDLGIVGSLGEADQVIRPVEGEQISLIRPGGALLITKGKGQARESALARAIKQRGIEIHTSRCGSLTNALAIFKESPDLVRTLEQELITHVFPLEEISTAFHLAGDSRESIKVLIKTGDISST